MGSGSTPINQQLKRHVERSGSLSQRPNAGNFSIFQLCTERFDELQHKARSMPREAFRREVEKELTGREEEPSELIYFKVYKSQIPVIEEAIETAALMLGTDKSRGYCLEMICADFLAGA